MFGDLYEYDYVDGSFRQMSRPTGTKHAPHCGPDYDMFIFASLYLSVLFTVTVLNMITFLPENTYVVKISSWVDETFHPSFAWHRRFVLVHI